MFQISDSWIRTVIRIITKTELIEAALRASVLSVCWRGSSYRIRIVIRNGLLDLDSDPDCHQNVISWSVGHIPALHKISSKSIGNFFDNPVNADFGLDSWIQTVIRIVTKIELIGPWDGTCPTPPRNFVKIRSQLFELSDGQTDRQTNRQTNRPNHKHNLLRRR